MFIDGGRRNFKKLGHLFLAQPDSFILYKHLNFWAISFTEEEWIWERKTTEIVSVQLLIGKYEGSTTVNLLYKGEKITDITAVDYTLTWQV